MIILAHRCNTEGPDVSTENSLAALRTALSLGFGVETDVRHADGFGFYINHEAVPPSASMSLEAHCQAWRDHPSSIIAINIKEMSHEDALVDALNSTDVARQAFLFDMELIEPIPGETATRLHTIDTRLNIAARVSDRGETVERALNIECARIVWLDEFERPWATRETIAHLKQAGRVVYAVSPELHGGSLESAVRRWRQFLAWGVDGICTDWPLLARNTLDFS